MMTVDSDDLDDDCEGRFGKLVRSRAGISTHHLPLLLPQSLRDDHLLTIMIMITTIFNAQALCDDSDHC